MKTKTSNTNNKNLDVFLHGEAMIFAASIPKEAKNISTSTPTYQIIADSETTGNHHVIDCGEGIEFFQQGDTLFMRNEKETQVRCLHADRHDTYTIPPGSWEFGIQQEYDHLAQHQRNVKD